MLRQHHLHSAIAETGDWDDKGRARHLNLYNLNAGKNLGFFPTNLIQFCITSMYHLLFNKMVLTGEVSGAIQAR